ncbi:hypothetical protein [Spirosoma litoris]
MPSELTVQWAQAIVRQEEEKREFMATEFKKMVGKMAKAKRAGSLTFLIRDQEPTVQLEFPDFNTFTIYQFSELEHIKASFELINKYICSGEQTQYYSSVDVGRNKTTSQY